MKSEDSLYKQLHEKEPTRYEMLEYGWALKELAEGTTARSLWEMLRHVSQAERYLAEFRGKMVPTPDLDNGEANIAIAFHTYMRKGMDCPLGTVLYRLIAENKGLPVWYAFVKAVNANSKLKNKKHIYQIAIRDAEGVYRTGNDNTDSLLMLSALRMWEDDFENALEQIKGE
jgi:hypothetical protein